METSAKDFRDVRYSGTQMITSHERRQRAKRLFIWYEVTSVVIVLTMLAALIASLHLPGESNFKQALIFRNEILIPTQDANSTVAYVRAFNLKTGRPRLTNYAPPDLGWVTDGVRLWSISSNEVVETDGTVTTKHRPNRGLNDLPFRDFLYEGKPAVIDRTTTAGVQTYHLLVWDEGDWQDRGQIATPGPNRAWTVPGSDDEPALLPRTTFGNAAFRADSERMSVLPCGGRYLLFHRDSLGGGNLTYHIGFDFITTSEEESASALAPANATAECSGWKKLPAANWRRVRFGVAEDRVVMTTFDANFTGLPNTLSWQVHDDQSQTNRMSFETVAQYGAEGSTAVLMHSFDDDSLYAIIEGALAGSSAPISRFHHGRLERLSVRIECAFSPIVNKLRWFCVGISIAIGVACAVWPILGTRLRAQSPDISIWRGHDCVQLASLDRRYLARAIDLLLVISPLIPPVVQALMLMDADWILSFISRTPSLSAETWLGPVFYLEYHLFASIAIWLLLTVTQGASGLSPGKWLCGIRLLSTRLRPCGFPRSLLRELFVAVDLAEPGMVGFLVSDHQQRLGDFYADTVVVNDTLTRERLG